MVKTANFETLLADVQSEIGGGYTFTLEGKTYHLQDRNEVVKVAESHGYIIIY